MRNFFRAALLSAVVAVAGCAHNIPDDGFVYLDQGWSNADRQWFYTTTQGSQLIPYDWFLAVEQADSEEDFRSDANINGYRYLTNVTTSYYNPDGLPVGMTKHEGSNGEAWMGFTCAACHTGQIDFQGTQMRIDGAPALGDHTAFHDGLIAALSKTASENAKFDRFAAKVLEDGGDDAARSDLRDRLNGLTVELKAWQARSHSPVAYGNARVDAFGIILNEVSGTALNLPENYRAPDAPVSYPFLWDTPQHDFVQWNGIARNGLLGSLGRNVGEVLGVFGELEVKKSRFGYRSSAETRNLRDMEDHIKKLYSPKWPEQLPAVDTAKAAAGQAHYNKYCAGCHVVLGDDERTDPKRKIKAKMAKVSKLGTDPRMATNFIQRTAKTGRLKGAKTKVIVGRSRLGEEEPAGALLSHVVKGVIIRRVVQRVSGPAVEGVENIKVSEKSLQAALAGLAPEGEENIETVELNVDSPLLAYKGRPLNGIWATAPYLHNGSVPNLYQLLLPSDQRVDRFTVGSREFDPVNVGFETEAFDGGFVFDASKTGNSNAGHDYGTGKLSDAERWELVEYMKTL
ncbi:di-heme-cytochrome C peroxidase [Pelagibius sp. Alg239-R121]|uniref:di-heme-cytochrome C peroxidase n=1 Tax=Pelagibius sp. Alg239-R121 TaxID=2993448 RepID=UPI0024A686F3|nr:di-heme-cytochrome C peroxidase [Pelagibius sp. Alg239-R121]